MKNGVFIFKDFEFSQYEGGEVTRTEFKVAYFSLFQKIGKNPEGTWDKNCENFEGKYYLHAAYCESDLSICVEMSEDTGSLTLSTLNPTKANQVMNAINDAINDV